MARTDLATKMLSTCVLDTNSPAYNEQVSTVCDVGEVRGGAERLRVKLGGTLVTLNGQEQRLIRIELAFQC